MLSAEQKVRQKLTGEPHGEPTFQHEGDAVVRWVTGGVLPDLYVTLQTNGAITTVRCVTCHEVLGEISAHHAEAAAQQLAVMRKTHTHV